MIYTAPIDSITWQAIEDFLGQGIKEGVYLDYKADWPRELERTIAAMANTIGGVILLGVGEEDDGKPRTPPIGVPFERGLSERVTNIVLSNITPPVFPEVAVCPDADKARALVVIRVSQSHQTPHATTNNRRVYLRTGNRNNPEELATVGEIEWLREHRARSLALREATYRTAIARSDIFLEYVSRVLPAGRLINPGVKPYLLLCASPYYPIKPLLSPPQLRPLIRDIRVRDYYGTDSEFPFGGGQFRLLQDGVYSFAKLKDKSGERAYYTEFSTIGQLFYRQTLMYQSGGDWQIRSSEIFARLDQFMRVAKRYLERLGFQGLVWIDVLLGSAARTTLGTWDPSEGVAPTDPCEDEAVQFESSLTVAEWDSQYEDVLIQAAQKIAWAYSWELTPGLVRQYFAKNRRV